MRFRLIKDCGPTCERPPVAAGLAIEIPPNPSSETTNSTRLGEREGLMTSGMASGRGKGLDD